MLTEVQIGIIVAVLSLTPFVVWLCGRQQAEGNGCEQQIYYELQEAKIAYSYKIKHSRLPFLIKLLYLFYPFKLRWHDEDVLKWGTVVVVANNEFGREVYRVEDFEIRRKGKVVKIIWPRGALIKPEANEIIVEVIEHVSQDEISKLIKMEIKKTTINKTMCRWEYKLKNDSEAVIREFELSLTDKVNNPKNISIVSVRPAFATNETDIVLKGECSLDMIKRGQKIKVNEIVWKLPEIGKRNGMDLIIEC